MFSVLLVCTGNICRSPMAEGFLRRMLPDFLKPVVAVGSAGTLGLHGNRAEPLAVRAAAAQGVDIGDHRARALDGRMVRAADLVVAMERGHLEAIDRMLLFRSKPVRLLGGFDPRRITPDIADPYGMPYAVYEESAREMMACMPGLIAHIRQAVQRHLR